jgi:hypothetical protein
VKKAFMASSYASATATATAAALLESGKGGRLGWLYIASSLARARCTPGTARKKRRSSRPAGETRLGRGRRQTREERSGARRSAMMRV